MDLHYVISGDQSNLSIHTLQFMRKLNLALLGLFVFVGCSQASQRDNIAANFSVNPRTLGSAEIQEKKSSPVDHSAWNAIVETYVNDQGLVNYKGIMADSAGLNDYLEMLSANAPDPKTWSESAQLAYWINAYNAFTIQLIIRNYPVQSIKDIAGNIPLINTSWDIKFIRIGDSNYDLNNIEHGIIRKQFDDERIHFALVCAAVSCPPLRREAYNAERLNEQLDDQARTFFKDKTKNQIAKDKAVISPILKWYRDDFRDKAEDTRTYINKYSKVKINPGVQISYADYDWALNIQR